MPEREEVGRITRLFRGSIRLLRGFAGMVAGGVVIAAVVIPSFMAILLASTGFLYVVSIGEINHFRYTPTYMFIFGGLAAVVWSVIISWQLGKDDA